MKCKKLVQGPGELQFAVGAGFFMLRPTLGSGLLLVGRMGVVVG